MNGASFIGAQMNFSWYFRPNDWTVGVYWSPQQRALYVRLVPMLGFRIGPRREKGLMPLHLITELRPWEDLE